MPWCRERVVEAGGGTMGNTRRRQAGGDGRDEQPPRPAGQIPGRWGCERRLTGVRWPEGWECERCSPVAGRNRTRRRARCPRHLSTAAGAATRHPEARLRRRSRAMWLLARSKRSVSAPRLAAQVGVSENTATLVAGRLRGAMARLKCLRRAVGISLAIAPLA